MVQFYLISGDSDETRLVDKLRAQTRGAAQREAENLVIANSLVEGGTPPYVDTPELLLVEAACETPLDASVLQERLTRAREKDANWAAWEEEYDRLRDELGHWRVLLRRGECARSQVTVLEDRLRAHERTAP